MTIIYNIQKASLTLIGTGIKFVSHLTCEAKTYLEQSDVVLYLVNDPAMKEWIQKINPNSKCLDKFYTQYPLRIDCYYSITDYILSVLRTNVHVCVAFYGHPSVFSKPGLDAVIQARKEGFYAKILPGISAEACLFADLLIDPGSCGCQSFEATDFLIHKRQFDPACHLVLWQIDIIGVFDNPEIHQNQHGAQILVNYLNQFYPLEHTIILYEAAQYPRFEPRIDKLMLGTLPQAQFSRISTLYIPPLHQVSSDITVLHALHMTTSNLKS